MEYHMGVVSSSAAAKPHSDSWLVCQGSGQAKRSDGSVAVPVSVHGYNLGGHHFTTVITILPRARHFPLKGMDPPRVKVPGSGQSLVPDGTGVIGLSSAVLSAFSP